MVVMFGFRVLGFISKDLGFGVRGSGFYGLGVWV